MSCKTCQEKMGAYSEWACANCEDLTEEGCPDIVREMDFLCRIREGGYPFDAEDLPPWKWSLLGFVVRIRREAEQERMIDRWASYGRI